MLVDDDKSCWFPTGIADTYSHAQNDRSVEISRDIDALPHGSSSRITPAECGSIVTSTEQLARSIDVTEILYSTAGLIRLYSCGDFLETERSRGSRQPIQR